MVPTRNSETQPDPADSDANTLLKVIVAAKLQTDIDSSSPAPSKPIPKAAPTPTAAIPEPASTAKSDAAPPAKADAAPPAKADAAPAGAPGAGAFAARMAELRDAVEQAIEVDAAPADCFRVAADFERYPEWAGSVQYARVLGRTPDGSLGRTAEFKVGAFGTTLGYTLEYDYDPPRRMQWTAVAGGVKELLGVYEFAPAAGGRTRVRRPTPPPAPAAARPTRARARAAVRPQPRVSPPAPPAHLPSSLLKRPSPPHQKRSLSLTRSLSESVRADM